jgi:hypothetical protein
MWIEALMKIAVFVLLFYSLVNITDVSEEGIASIFRVELFTYQVTWCDIQAYNNFYNDIDYYTSILSTNTTFLDIMHRAVFI